MTIPTLNRSKSKVYNNIAKIYSPEHVKNILYKNPIVCSEVVKEQWTKRGIAEDREKSIYQSMARTKKSIYDYAFANDWEWFLTFTFNPQIVDRYNFDDVSKKMSNWFNLTRKRKSKDLKYLCVPEQHKDGAWHFHAIISNIGNLAMIDSGKTDSTGKAIFNIKDFRLGFSTATKVSDTSKVSSYISKYITKDLVEHTFNKKRYWVSKNLNRPIEIKTFHDSEHYEQKLLNNIQYSEGFKMIPIVSNEIEVQTLYITSHNSLKTLPPVISDAIELFGIDKVRIIMANETL